MSIPNGWQIDQHDNGVIVVQKRGECGYASSVDVKNIASTTLHALARDMLAVVAAPIGEQDDCVDFGFDDRSVRVSQEAYSIFIAREAGAKAQISQLQDDLTTERLRADVAVADCNDAERELTKARELLGETATHSHHFSADLTERVYQFRFHQSAPAAKGEPDA